MKSKFTKRDIAKMQRIYQQTLNCTATALACGCSRGYVAKMRDRHKWVTPKQINELADKNKNDTTLTPEIAIKLAAGWRLHINDKDLCPVVGITQGQLVRWLRDDREVTIVVNVRRSDGTEIKRMEKVGLWHLREREWANFQYSMLQGLIQDIDDAKLIDDHATAARTRQWLLSKIESKTFGDKAGVEVNVNTATQINQINLDDLDIETKKNILKQLRAKNIKG